MSLLFERSKALTLLNDNVKNKNLIKHCIATEAIMKRLARRFSKDETLWGITGLIHDLDLELTRDAPHKHAITTVKMLSSYDYPEEGLRAILAHNGDVLEILHESDFDYALTCAETITGLIVATALVYPDKKLKSVKPKSVKKRMKEKWFAKSVNRDSILLCEKIGISIEEFIELSLDAMCEIDNELGL
ncbi:HDIG domain-containing metalloprotein [Thermodesulfobacteriota bacterium]